MSDLDKIINELDKSNPRWFIEMADQRELQTYVSELTNGISKTNCDYRLRQSIAARLFLPIVNAAIYAGVVEVKS